MMSDAEDDAETNASTGDKTEVCTDCKAKEEQQKNKQEELEEEAGVEQKTKGKTRHGEKDGGFDEANKDFDSLKPDNVKDIDTKYGSGRTGSLENGDKITVRPGSSDGRSTLQIRKPNGRQTEIRYNPVNLGF